MEGDAIAVGSPMFSTAGLVDKAPIVSVLGDVLFFVVAHPFLFKFVDSVVESVVGTGVQRDLLVFIHAVIFGLLMFGSLYLIDFLSNQ